MDLEHTKLGQHCAVEACHQRDFLPFTCDTCKKKLCLEHRHYKAHNCNGAEGKDMTSIDCPLCGKSVKFTKADNPDIVWEDHYLQSCTQQQKQVIASKCHEKTCLVNLGPSNSFVCGKCKQKVCLSHRIPEDHHCQGMRGAVLSKLTNLPTSNNKSSALITSTQPKANIVSSNAKKLSTTTAPISNGTSSSSTENMKKVKPNTNNFECPFCSKYMSDPTDLQNHINEKHPDNPSFSTSVYRVPPVKQKTVTNPAPIKTTNNNPLAREVCPVCNARFVDPIELVSHFEIAHPASHSQQHESTKSTSQTDGQCALG